VTNILRHSDAAACSITLTRGRNGVVRLEIINDGVREPPTGSGTGPGGQGNGLIGLAERARACSGELTAGPLPGGRYRLRVELSEETR
jgi:two-component system sensor histidine kinase DesK